MLNIPILIKPAIFELNVLEITEFAFNYFNRSCLQMTRQKCERKRDGWREGGEGEEREKKTERGQRTQRGERRESEQLIHFDCFGCNYA